MELFKLFPTDVYIEKNTEINDITFCCNKVIIQEGDKKIIELNFDKEVLDGVSNGNFSTVQRLIFTNGKNRYMFSKFREESNT